jgi:hypothetical protein
VSNLESSGGPLNPPALRERRRIARIMVAITLTFAVCWLPVHLMHMDNDFGAGVNGEQEGLRVGSTITGTALIYGFCFAANAINPFLYCMLSRHFRQHFRLALTCSSSSSTSSSSPDAVVLNGRARPVPPVALPPSPNGALRQDNDDVIVIDLENAYDEIDDVEDDVSVDRSAMIYIGDTAALNSTLTLLPGKTTLTTRVSFADEEKEGLVKGEGRRAEGSRANNLYVPLPSVSQTPQPSASRLPTVIPSHSHTSHHSSPILPPHHNPPTLPPSTLTTSTSTSTQAHKRPAQPKTVAPPRQQSSLQSERSHHVTSVLRHVSNDVAVTFAASSGPPGALPDVE